MENPALQVHLIHPHGADICHPQSVAKQQEDQAAVAQASPGIVFRGRQQTIHLQGGEELSFALRGRPALLGVATAADNRPCPAGGESGDDTAGPDATGSRAIVTYVLELVL